MFGFSKNNSQDKINDLENDKDILERRFKTVEQIVNTMPLGVITFEKQSGYFVYINDTSKKILKEIKHPLSSKNIEDPKKIHIHDFIPKAELDHALIQKEKSFPLNKVVQIGSDFIDVEFNIISQGNAGLERLMLTWRLVTERETYKKESNKLNQVLNKLPETVFMIDPESLKFTYLNESAHKSLQQLRGQIQINVDNPVGESILNLIKTPGAEQSIRTGDGLPVSRRIQYGDQDLNINLSPVTGMDGKYLTTVLNWNIITAQVNVERIVAESVESIKKHSEVLHAQSNSMSAAADSNLNTANAVTHAAQLASSNVENVAAGTEELGASVQSIGDQINRSSVISQQANERAQQASKQVEELAIASQKIGDVVKLINDIAEQTNLLALNATIEAARAGDAGRGFAVVASEVKSLATQTATATEDITVQIEAIQSETQNMVGAMNEISSVINEVNEISSEISISAEQQSKATQEIAGNAQKAADGTQDVSSHIIEVQNVANSNKVGIQQVLDVSIELGGQAEKLDAEIKNLIR